MKQKIVLATTNKHKKIEINKIINSDIIEFIDCSDLNITLDVEENGNTYKKNAYIKAQYVFDKTGLPSCSDDSGIEIEYLNYEPGIKSARFLEDLNYYEKNTKILEMLKSDYKRYARYVCAVSYISQNKSFFVEEICEGTISNYIRGTKGFGYDPIFIPKGYKNTFGELSSDIKNKISHRAKAFRKLLTNLT